MGCGMARLCSMKGKNRTKRKGPPSRLVKKAGEESGNGCARMHVVHEVNLQGEWRNVKVQEALITEWHCLPNRCL